MKIVIEIDSDDVKSVTKLMKIAIALTEDIKELEKEIK